MVEENTISKNIRVCNECGSDKTRIVTTKQKLKNGQIYICTYPHWYTSGVGGHICDKCRDNKRYKNRNEYNKRICSICGSDKTNWRKDSTLNAGGVFRWYKGQKYKKDGWLCRKCRDKLVYSISEEYKIKHASRYREIQKQMTYTLFKILDQNACVYCGCQLFPCLQFDHKNGGGSKERKRLSTYTWKKYYITHPEEAREKLQITCANCNWLKRWKDSGISNLLV